MSLEHALLVSLSEQPAAGLDLTRRFERSIGFFWRASHQQIYRVLARMERDGWVEAQVVPQSDRPSKRVYAVTPAGTDVLTDWLAQPSEIDPIRSELIVKMRGASYGDRTTLLAQIATLVLDHEARRDHFRHLMARDFPTPGTLRDADLDQYLVLRAGIALEDYWITILTDYITAHQEAAR